MCLVWGEGAGMVLSGRPVGSTSRVDQPEKAGHEEIIGDVRFRVSVIFGLAHRRLHGMVGT